MMHVDFMDAATARSADLSVPDVYYSADYASSAELIDRGTWECAVAEGGAFYLPYLRREVPHGGGSYDIVSPYGYTSVVAPSAEGRSDFVDAFREASRKRGLVAEFVRGHPFDMGDPAQDGYPVDRVREHPTFSVDLSSGGVEAYWQSSEGRHRTAVRKAERHEIEVVESAPVCLCDVTSAFRRLYDATMERVGSSSRLRLGDDYYRALTDGLGGRVRVLEARRDGDAVAASVFLAWDDRLHYHLSGSTDEGMRLGATNALLDHAVRHLLRPGGRLHLGGGVGVGDGLERFKRSIGNIATTVRLCETVVDRPRYDELVRAAGVDESADYFPAYRA